MADQTAPEPAAQQDVIELDANIVIQHYQQRLADVTHENILLKAQLAQAQRG